MSFERAADDNGDVVLRELLPEAAAHAIGVYIEGEPYINVVILDTETTGLVAGIDRVIEVALLPLMVHARTGDVVWVGDTFVQQQDPGIPIPPEVTKVHGYTNEMLKGKAINWAEVRACLDSADVVIAHNAKFDRPFVDLELKRRKISTDAVWACSMSQIEWKKVWGIPTQSLEFIAAYDRHVWYKAHKADADVHAVLCILNAEGRLLNLVNKALLPSYRLWARKSPYEQKDTLKARGGYQYYSADKVWHKLLDTTEELNEEEEWLRQNIYFARPYAAEVQTIAPNERFREGV